MSPAIVARPTRIEQANNTRTNHRITIGGRTQTLTEWMREVRIASSTVGHRKKIGWPEQVWFIPPGANSLSYLTMTAEAAAP
jgi:hypothetical protein